MPLSKYRMLKTIDIRPVKQTNVKKYIFKNLPQTKSSIANFRNNANSMAFYNVPNSTKESLNMNKEVYNFYKLRKPSTKENSMGQKNNENFSETFWSGDFMPFATLHKSSNLPVQKNLRMMVKRLWFFDTAAPIPGVSSLKKKKRL
jgi:hypothetical protein